MASLICSHGLAQDRTVLIKNGRVLDVTGDSWMWADVLVRWQRILANPHRYSEGMVYVVVNGEMAMRDGTFTGQRLGRVLRKTGGPVFP